MLGDVALNPSFQYRINNSVVVAAAVIVAEIVVGE